jgi:hypothetical protein
LDKLAKVGKKVPELNNEAIRELSLYSYRIIYEIKNQDVFVLAVMQRRWGSFLPRNLHAQLTVLFYFDLPIKTITM